MSPISDNRIDRKFRELKARGQKAFVAYITAGDPSPEMTPQLVWALERAGADIVELGVPFSDPLADGVVNQLAAQRALEAGTTLPKLLRTVEAIRRRTDVPIVLFTFPNPRVRRGLAETLPRARDAGVDGALVLALPLDEARGADAFPAD